MATSALRRRHTFIPRRIAFFFAVLIAGFVLTELRQVLLFRAATTATTRTQLIQNAPNLPFSKIDDSNLSKVQSGKELSFQDLTLGKYMTNGGVNIVSSVTLPDWWWEQEGREPSRMLIKIAGDVNYSSYEIEALRLLNSDKDAARKYKVVELIFADKNLTNPFRGLDPHKNIESGKDQIKSFWNSVPTSKAKYLSKLPQIAAHVVPYLQLAPSWPSRYEHLGTLREIRVFMKSFLSQMEYALSLGLNNGDLNGKSNVMYDEQDGGALIIDWNGGQNVDEVFYATDVNFGIIPPEAWIEYIMTNGTKVQLRYTNLWQYDVWSIGILFARLIYFPCFWEDGSTFDQHPPVHYDRLRATLLAIGGNVMIPMSSHPEDGEFDLAYLVGLNRTEVEALEFEPMLGQKTNRGSRSLCKQTSFWRLDNKHVSKTEKTHAIDFLKSMLKISPRDRPNYETLLKHPFLQSL